MSTLSHALRPNRGYLRLHGDDVDEFLQGLITVDVTKCTPATALYGALLTPQGKFLHDFFLVRQADGGLILETEADRLPLLHKKLKLHKLRAKVTLEDVSADWKTIVYFGDIYFGDSALNSLAVGDAPGTCKEIDGGVAYVDPRLSALGARVLLGPDAAPPIPSPEGDFDLFRMQLGVPEGASDLVVEKSILLENGFDELGAVDWNKGCYMGQELTARTKYRGLVKKRLMPIRIDGATPEPGSDLMKNDKVVGEIRRAQDGHGLAMVKLTALAEDGSFSADGAAVTVTPPDWAVLAEAK